MPSQTVTCRAVAATRTALSKPSTAFVTAAQSQLWVRSANGYAFLNFGLPRDLEGKTVTSAKLQVCSSSAWGGSRTITAQRHAVPAGESYSKLTWNNQPGTLSGSTAATTSATMAGSTWWYELDVTSEMQLVANGSDYHGFRITTSDATARYFIGPSHATLYPRLILVLADTTPAPDLISPEGVTSLQKPTFVWDAPDDISAVQAQAGAVGTNFSSPAWDSGSLSSLVGQVNTNTAGWAGLAAAASADLRFRQFGPLGWSPWSSSVTVTRQTRPTLTATTPTPSGTTNDPTPQHQWTFTPQASFHLWITDANGKTVYDSGRTAGSDQSWTPTITGKIPDLLTLTSHLRTWDTRTDRVASPGDPGYAETQWTWTLAIHAGTAAVASLSATAVGAANKLNWTRSGGAPDEWIVKRGDDLIARFDGTEGQLTGTTWEFYDWTAPPNTALTYNVIPVVGVNAGLRGPTASITNAVRGVWVYDPVTGGSFSLGDATVGMNYAESSLIYVPAFGSTPIKRSLALRGMEGPVSGTLTDYAGRTILQQVTDLMVMRGNPNRLLRLIWGSHNIPVLVSNLSPVVLDDVPVAKMWRRVQFDAVQVGELPAELP